MVLSLLPDTTSVPSAEKARDITLAVCSERTDLRVPVIASWTTISPELSPDAMISFLHAKASKVCSNEATREDVPHLSGRPLTTLTPCKDSAVYHPWSQDEEGQNGRILW